MDKLMQNIRTFSSVDFQDHSGLLGTCFSRTVKIFLNNNDDIFISVGEWESCLQSISVNDYHFAKKPGGFCKGSISFYANGSSFSHNTNQYQNAWKTEASM